MAYGHRHRRGQRGRFPKPVTIPNPAKVQKFIPEPITTAVDAVEIARRKFVKETIVDKVTIGTEEMPPREGESNSRNISSIEITLKRS